LVPLWVVSMVRHSAVLLGHSKEPLKAAHWVLERAGYLAVMREHWRVGTMGLWSAAP
jgi:hypothetical protein